MKKRTIAIYIIAVSIISTVAFGSKYANATNNTIELEEYVRIQCQSAEISDIVGDDSVLPGVYATVESHKLNGENEKKAEENAKEDILIREATYKYAINNGFSLSEEDLQNKFKELIGFIQETEEYAEIQNYYIDNGQTIEDNVYSNYKFYETEFVIDKLYSFHQRKYNNGDNSFENKYYSTWEDYWSAIQRSAMKMYEKSSDYDALNIAIETSIDILDSVDVELIDDNSMSSELDIDDTNVYDMLTYNHLEDVK